MKITSKNEPYKFAKQFTDTPGGEYPNSPFYIDMEGVFTLGASFLDEAFAKLAKDLGKTKFNNLIIIDFRDDNWAKSKLDELIEKRISE